MHNANVILRTAVPEDASAILDLYSPYIRDTAISFESDVPSVTDMEKRIEKCLVRYPWLVCYIDNILAGYAYASVHRERTAYQWTCECSVYVHNNFKGKGIAAELYQALMNILKMQGIRNVYAGITLPNDASISFHEKCGFEHFATYDDIGYKLGSWHKVGWWRLRINELDKNPSPPLYFSQVSGKIIESVCKLPALRIKSRVTSHTDLK